MTGRQQRRWCQLPAALLSQVGLLLLGLAYTGFVASEYLPGLRGDEIGYVSMATDLAAARGPVVLWWGPGYPLVLAPFIRLGIPLYWANFANVLFMLGTLLYMTSALNLYLSPRRASLIALTAGIYPPFWWYSNLLVAEKFAGFLLSGAVFHYLKLHKSADGRSANLIAASLHLGFLALTKVFYGYVILASICLALTLRLLRRERLQPALATLGLAMLWCLPWLGYTYHRSGHLFYWATSGGSSLYCMSTPFPGETGAWFRPQDVENVPGLLANHGTFYRSTAGLSVLERDAMFKRRAIHNIVNHPAKFLANCGANVSRLLFDYPYDYSPGNEHCRLLVIFPNITLLTLFVVSIVLPRKQVIPLELLSILGFATVAFAGSIPLSAYNRMLTVLVPILAVWIPCVLRCVQPAADRPVKEQSSTPEESAVSLAADVAVTHGAGTQHSSQ